MPKCLTFKELVLLSPTPIIRDMQQTAADLRVQETLLEALRDLSQGDTAGVYLKVSTALETLGVAEPTARREVLRLSREYLRKV